MITHALDRPIWDSLTTGHHTLAKGTGYAKRFPRNISPFAAIPDESGQSLNALAELLTQVDECMLIQTDPIICPDDCSILMTAEGVQMELAEFEPSQSDQHQLVQLQAADAPEMLELAQLTRPGPYAEQTHQLGHFLGVREDGQLIAMAGERLKHDRYVELSAVCTHPNHRGRGLARLLSIAVTKSILKRGKIPYLQAFATNKAAIDLYERIGYRVRTRLHVAALAHLSDHAEDAEAPK